MFIRSFLFAFVSSLLINNVTVVAAPVQNWPAVSLEQREREYIMEQIAIINERFAAFGAYSSPARKGAVAQFLKNLNTPVSFKVYNELVATGSL